jgi:hypothetical protein
MHRHSLAGMALLAVALVAACGSKAKVGGTATGKVTAINLGRSVNPDRTISASTDTFAPTDTIYAVVQTETLGGAKLKVRWTYEDGQTVNESTQNLPSSGGTIWSEFHVSKPDGWPLGKYHLQVSLDSAAAGVKEFTVK